MPRPKTYDPELVLTRAMELFWINGFQRTSLSELEAHLNLSRVSLYGAFGDKKSLFLKCLQKYRQNVALPLLEPLGSRDGLSGIQQFFEQLTNAPRLARQRGCLLVNTLVSGDNIDPDVDSVLQDHLQYIERRFAQAVKAGVTRGTIRKGTNSRATAAMLTTLAHGAFALNRTESGSRLANAAIRTALRALGAASV